MSDNIIKFPGKYKIPKPKLVKFDPDYVMFTIRHLFDKVEDIRRDMEVNKANIRMLTLYIGKLKKELDQLKADSNSNSNT